MPTPRVGGNEGIGDDQLAKKTDVWIAEGKQDDDDLTCAGIIA